MSDMPENALNDVNDEVTSPLASTPRPGLEAEDSRGALAPPVPGCDSKPSTSSPPAVSDPNINSETATETEPEPSVSVEDEEEKTPCPPAVVPPTRPLLPDVITGDDEDEPPPQQNSVDNTKAAARATSQDGQKIGAVSVSPTFSTATTATESSNEFMDEMEPPEEEADESKPQDELMLSAELVTDHDVEAQVEQRVRQETNEIAAEVQRRILGEAVVANVVVQQQQPKEPPATKQRSYDWKLWTVAGAVVGVVLIVAIAVALVLSNGGGDEDSPSPAPISRSMPPTAAPTTPLPTGMPTPAPTQMPTPAPTGRIDRLRGLLEEEFGIIEPNTPQGDALHWIAYVDPLNLSADGPFRILKERYVIVAFYFATNGEGWIGQYDFLKWTSICDWNNGRGSFTGNGVFCNDGDSVTQIILDENNLVGPLIPEITSLGSLQRIELDGNSVSGSIPSTIGDLRSLTWLTVNSNDISGTIPSTLFELPRLEVLVLSQNDRITGQIPDNIGNASRLRLFALYKCTGLSGTVPSSITELASLERISLVGILLEGTLPAFNASGIEFIALEKNSFTGTIPASFGNLPNLELLSLSENLLQGPIPSMTGSTSLTTLWLFDNLLSGNLETFLNTVHPSGLVELDLGTNRLTGSIPPSISQFTDLRDLRLDANGLNGTLPSELGLLVGLREFLNVFDNDLSGQIPTELGLLTNLELLDVGSNRLTGLLPSEIGSLARAVGIGVQQNELSGTVPTEIGALSNLEQLLLARNHFVGSLDAFFCVSRLDDPLYDFQSDCLEIQCSCCTTCCSDIDGSCIEQ